MDIYIDIFLYFLKLGFVAFGGPAAHIAMMEKDLVEDKKWMSKQEFLDYIGITNLIPGPNSTEMTMHCGYHRGGQLGLLIAGVSFITPAVLLTGIVAYFFFKYEDLSLLQSVTDGFKVIVLIIIAQASYKLFKKAAKNNYLLIIALISAIIYWFYPNEILILIGLIVLSLAKYFFKSDKILSIAPVFPFLFAATSITPSKIFLGFLKIGSILFGSGYVLFAYLETMFVDELGLLSLEDLLDAVAIGQFTPGPVLSTSTFIGYQLNSWEGAIGATLGIFLPAFIFVAITSPLLKKIRKNPVLGEVLDVVNAASLAFIGVVAIKLCFGTIVNWQGVLILITGAILLFKLKWNTILLLVLGGISYPLLMLVN